MDWIAGEKWSVADKTMKVGDRITRDVPVYRRWWQFWRPRVVGKQRKTYVIVSSSKEGPLTQWPMREV